MSGYFGALMRASGMAIAARAPAMARAEPRVVEIDVERNPAPTPPRTAQTPSGPHQAVAPTRVANSVEQLAPPAQLAADTDTHEVRAGFAGTAQAHPRAATDAAADSPAAPAAGAVETAKPALGQTLVRAAMQWVAADTHQVRSVAQAVPRRGQSLAAPGEEPSVTTTTQAFRDRGVEVQAQPPSATPATTAAPDLAARAPVEAQALPMRSVRPSPATPPAPVAPLARDEVFEIAIGAIHVRVDAPAAQTVARTAATPPGAARRAAIATPPRSALARRALRRI